MIDLSLLLQLNIIQNINIVLDESRISSGMNQYAIKQGYSKIILFHSHSKCVDVDIMIGG